MKQLVLQELRKGDLAIILTLCGLGFSLTEGLILSILLEEWSNPAERLCDLIIMLLCALPFGGAAILCVHDFHKSILITEDSVTWMSGKNVIKTIPKDQIIAYGVFSQREKHTPGCPFFCYATTNEVAAIARKYWHWRKRIYRKKQLEELEKTPEGIWTLQMSIYFWWERLHLEHNRKLICANHISKEELHSIWALWQRKPMLLGSIALYFPWRHL